MLSLKKESERFESTSARLQKIGIYPTRFEAADGSDPKLSARYLQENAVDYSHRSKESGFWFGINSTHVRAVQALAVSHKRALEAAQKRNNSWTAILEDDAIPVNGLPLNFAEEFEKVWSKL